MNLALVLTTLGWYLTSRSLCDANVRWSLFETSQHYSNLRLITNEGDVFQQLYYSKGLPLVQARMECSHACASNDDCHAFNFYENEQNYVCERQPQNLCSKVQSRAVITLTGSLIWNKLTDDTRRDCVDPSYSTKCEIMRPGCLGTWPHCYNCTRHCRDCKARYNFLSFSSCTFWPDGDTNNSTPVFGSCSEDTTFLFKRKVNVITGNVDEDYRMSTDDMFRVSRLQVYKKLGFWFGNNTVLYHTFYSNPRIDESGALMNIFFIESLPPNLDIFHLKGASLQPTPFVYVNNDKYGCGSFWLLDTKNVTYCPGGEVSLLGSLKMKVNSTQLISTGIRWPVFNLKTLLTYGAVGFC